MKRFYYLLLLLFVAGGVASCQKDYQPQRQPAPEPEVQMSAEERAMLGLWARSVESEDVYYGAMRQDAELRLYEEGRGQMLQEFYTDGVLSSWSRGALSYRIEDGILYIGGPHGEDVVAWNYTLLGDTLTLTTDYDGEVVKWSFTRTEDADDRLVGCWDAATVDASGGRVERHYKFATPTYGDVYEMVYDQRGVCTDTRFLYDFRYTISGDRIQFKMLVGGTDGVIFNKYFRLEGTKLYLRDKVNGEEVMYSNFYEENGLPFHP